MNDPQATEPEPMRQRMAILSFVALIGVLGLSALVSLGHAETNPDVAKAIFGTMH